MVSAKKFFSRTQETYIRGSSEKEETTINQLAKILKVSEEESLLEKVEVLKRKGSDFGENDHKKKDTNEHMIQERKNTIIHEASVATRGYSWVWIKTNNGGRKWSMRKLKLTLSSKV